MGGAASHGLRYVPSQSGMICPPGILWTRREVWSVGHDLHFITSIVIGAVRSLTPTNAVFALAGVADVAEPRLEQLPDPYLRRRKWTLFDLRFDSSARKDITKASIYHCSHWHLVLFEQSMIWD
jgi:hypothetical protein